jgi:hypothetical protein
LLQDLKEHWTNITKNYDKPFEDLELEESTLWELNKNGAFKSGKRIQAGHFGEYTTYESVGLYYFEERKMYVLLAIYHGSCDGCIGNHYSDENGGDPKLVDVLDKIISRATIYENETEARDAFKQMIEVINSD